MKKFIVPVVLVFFFILSSPVYAVEEDLVTITPVPITAEEAFIAVQTQSDPITGKPAAVALIDVRTRAEYFWVGAACQVDYIITTNEREFKPDLGLVFLSSDGRFLNFEINGRNRRLNVRRVLDLKLSPIGINIPFKLWDENTATLSLNPRFLREIFKLSNDKYGGYDTLIFFCRSGGRSEDCLEDLPAVIDVFDAYYEIDQPNGENGFGGFEGTSYGNVYNGYRGFPDRLTEIQENNSVSWKDTGLPIKTSLSPLPKAE